EEHQLDRHEQHDQVAAVEEDADHADREQHGREHQIMGEIRRQVHSFSAGMETSVTRASLRVLTWSPGSCARWSLRRRRVSDIAAMIATSRITAAVSKAN